MNRPIQQSFHKLTLLLLLCAALLLLHACADSMPQSASPTEPLQDSETTMQSEAATSSEEKYARITVPFSQFVLENAEGKRVTCSGKSLDLGGSMKVYDMHMDHGGGSSAAGIILSVDTSDSYSFETKKTTDVSVELSGPDDYRSLSGDGICEIFFDISGRTIRVEGESITYRAWLPVDEKTAIQLIGENEGSFTISIEGDSLKTEGLTGEQTMKCYCSGMNGFKYEKQIGCNDDTLHPINGSGS